MKTSNKILLGLLIIIFAVPFLLATSLKGKMNKGEYTVVKNERSGNMRSGSFTAFKVVKVVGPGPDFLTCHLKLSDDMNYKYYQHTKEDSVRVFTSNDTLYIKYRADEMVTNQNEQREYDRKEIHISLPALNNLVVDGAVVVIDSFPASLSNLSVLLKNRGVIKDGTKSKDKESAKVIPAADVKRNRDLQVSKNPEAKVISETDNGSLLTIQTARLEILDVDIKYLLISRLLYRF